jgi:hypothetical protein
MPAQRKPQRSPLAMLRSGGNNPRRNKAVNVFRSGAIYRVGAALSNFIQHMMRQPNMGGAMASCPRPVCPSHTQRVFACHHYPPRWWLEHFIMLHDEPHYWLCSALSPLRLSTKPLVKKLQEKHNNTLTKILPLPDSGYTLWIEAYRYVKGMRRSAHDVYDR